MPLAPVVTDPLNAFSPASLPSPKVAAVNLHLSQAPAIPAQVAAPPVAAPVISSGYQADPEQI